VRFPPATRQKMMAVVGEKQMAIDSVGRGAFEL
jgi:hypothetical protein